MPKPVTYTEEEIDSILAYTGRKELSKKKKTEKPTSIADILGFKGHNQMNSLLRYLTNPSEKYPPYELKNLFFNDYKALFSDIENLFSVACKYGFTHELDKKIKRGDPTAARMIAKGKDQIWVSDQFLSCSTYDVRNFATSNHGLNETYIDFNFDPKDIKNKKIPFIDVNDILSSYSHVHDGEKEIILTPYFQTASISLKTMVPRPGASQDPFRDFFTVEMTSKYVKPKTQVTELTDKDIEEYISLALLFYKANSEEDLKPENMAKLNSLREKMNNYLQTRFSQIYLKTLTQVLTKQELRKFFIEEALDSITRTNKIYGSIGTPSMDRELAEGMADQKMFEIELEEYYQEVFPNISHAERINRELSFLYRNPGHYHVSSLADRDAIELTVHAIVEDREDKLGLEVSGLRVFHQSLLEAKIASKKGGDITDYIDYYEKQNLAKFRAQQPKIKGLFDEYNDKTPEELLAETDALLNTMFKGDSSKGRDVELPDYSFLDDWSPSSGSPTPDSSDLDKWITPEPEISEEDYQQTTGRGGIGNRIRNVFSGRRRR